MTTSLDVEIDARSADDEAVDALTMGRRIRQLRTARGMTLDELAAAVERAPSQLSMIENGKREPKLTLLRAISRALGTTLDALLESQPLDERATLEIQLERAMRGQTFQALGIAPFRVGKTVPTEALKAMIALQGEIERLRDERSATPEEARRANVALRRLMRTQNNYFADLEQHARGILDAVGHPGGPLTQRTASDIAAHLGFTLHYVPDLPQTTRSVADIKNGRLYLSSRVTAKADPRTAVLQALSSRILGHSEPHSYAEFLRQRVETNYLTGALLIPEAHVVPALRDAKARRALSIEDLRDTYSVSYETAAHRFTNLATTHLGIPVHFLKVHESGTITKAYENDDVNFPTDRLGSIEGQMCCRKWTSRVVFDVDDHFNPYYQYTDTGNGTYWCTARVEASSEGAHSVSVGVRFDDTKWFLGRDTPNRGVSKHSVEACCRRAPADLESAWREHSWPNVRTPRTLLATLPTGSFPGVDSTEVYEFLEAHAPR
ncbi:helix-turn-helix domain-containing protein [Microbacterium sp. zg.Y1090]|uniref:helix-turn-helix transcriptional regulator n=1 Tax=Microbacterium TaxID=33882 RepID=UPI00214BB73F|nr:MULTISPECIES: helix-turn-helix transcriptional regulator [unclassified Microbacterium]MCR2812607.1 helix-turn-helix domain-containing protein [Microbacterium sp. zg.Y1084]MCR2817597.1 helix-turn-helix domain-containing protein [Microbacterium sp. zg.Y1090]MDL5485760.1 helix-turn-helix domain-containing protein [Microbacterium sp. zg-Y1211]WIM28926.1 helix-turn-helix domain-containing protein [Microbacterium sp. zg-Y1090]